MNIANTADLHLRGKDLDACREQLAALVMECVRREVKLLCIAGDVFERSTIGDNHASTGAIAAVAIHSVKELTKHGIQVLMIPGNHDQSGAGSADALHVFDGMDGVFVVRTNAYPFIRSGRVTVACVPWDWSGLNCEEAIKTAVAIARKATPESQLMLLSHIQVIGSRMSGRFTCEPKPGAWQVSRSFLESLPVDHIALGDFHTRQELVPDKGGYVGALRQCNFGEEGNPAGFEIWDSETNQTEWVELDAAPKYLTKVRGQGDHEIFLPNCRPQNTIMRVQYEWKPDPCELASLESAGIQVEQILDRQERIARAEVPADMYSRPHDLIDTFLSTQNPRLPQERVDRIHRTYDKHLQNIVAASKSPSVGGTFTPHKLTLDHVGPHENTTVDFDKCQSLMAITADPGTGKTWLMECWAALFWGEFLWWNGSWAKAQTIGYSGKSRIEGEFSRNGHRYRAERIFSAKGHVSALLYDLDSATPNEPIAGPKNGDFIQASTNIVGTLKSAAATWLMSQHEMYDMVGVPGAQGLDELRRSIFLPMVGADCLDPIEKAAAIAITPLRGALSECQAQLGASEDFDREILEERALIDQRKRINLPERRNDLLKAEENLEKLRCQLRDAQGDDATLNAQIAEYERAQKAAQDAQKRVEQLTAECKTLEERAAGLEQAAADAHNLQNAITYREALQQQLVKYQTRDKWELLQDHLFSQVASASKQVETLEQVPGCDEDTKALALTLDDCLEEYRKARAENDAIAQRNQSRSEKRRDFQDEIARLSSQIHGIETRLSRKPETPFGERCAPCPLLKEYADLPTELDNLKQRLEATQTALSAIAPDEETTDLTALIQRGQQARSAAEQVKAAEETVKRLDAAREAMGAAQRALDEVIKGEPEKVDDPRLQLAQVQKEIDTLAGAPERVKTCEQAALDLHDKGMALRDLIHRVLAEAESACAKSKPIADSARSALTDRESQRSALIAQIAELEKTVSDLRKEIESLTGDIARHETRIEELVRREQEHHKRAERARELQDEIDALSDIRWIFGVKGVKQLIIDAEACELSKHCDILLDRATGGTKRMRVSTQAVNGDGSISEAFDILATDDKSERDISRFSGGEREILRAIFRLAIIRWLGERRGIKQESIWFDEPFTAFGENDSGIIPFRSALDLLDVNKFVTITHMTALSSTMPSVVCLKKHYCGVSVEVVGERGVGA
jgi:DNA repair exonuclease SbcCD ATPase subunit/DNA repair exonuclease SbcCD nuclease subunit